MVSATRRPDLGHDVVERRAIGVGQIASSRTVDRAAVVQGHEGEQRRLLRRERPMAADNRDLAQHLDENVVRRIGVRIVPEVDGGVFVERGELLAPASCSWSPTVTSASSTPC